jgi:hypothetical protein
MKIVLTKTGIADHGSTIEIGLMHLAEKLSALIAKSLGQSTMIQGH